MFQVGDRVIYGSHGVCRIVTQEWRVIDRRQIAYFVLEPLSVSGSRFLVPCDNPVALSKLRKLLTREELEALLTSDQVRCDQWIDDENARKQRYKELINGGDRAALLGMLHTLHDHKKAQMEAGKKFHQCDSNFLNDAQKWMTGEFASVLDMEPAEVIDYIIEAISK